MSAGDQAPRPSVPHALTRVRTDRAPTVPPIDEAETVRENVDPAFGEMVAVLRDPAGVTVESLLKLLQISQRHSTAATRQADKLGVDLGVGRLDEKIDSVVGTLITKRRRREWVSMIGFVASGIASAIMGVWMAVAPKAREAAEVAVIAPAIEAKRVAAVAVDRADDHEARIAAMERSQKEILGAIEKLNGAVVMVIDRLPDPPPHEIVVPTPRRGKKAGLDE